MYSPLAGPRRSVEARPAAGRRRAPAPPPPPRVDPPPRCRGRRWWGARAGARPERAVSESRPRAGRGRACLQIRARLARSVNPAGGAQPAGSGNPPCGSGRSRGRRTSSGRRGPTAWARRGRSRSCSADRRSPASPAVSPSRQSRHVARTPCRARRCRPVATAPDADPTGQSSAGADDDRRRCWSPPRVRSRRPRLARPSDDLRSRRLGGGGNTNTMTAGDRRVLMA
jgi:hypothetical protein